MDKASKGSLHQEIGEGKSAKQKAFERLQDLMGSREPDTYSGWLSARHREFLGSPTFAIQRAVFQLVLGMECRQLALATLLVERGLLQDEDLERLPKLNSSPQIREGAVSRTRDFMKAQMAAGVIPGATPGDLPPGVTHESFLAVFLDMLCGDKNTLTVEDTEKFLTRIGVDVERAKKAFTSGVS